MAKKIVIIGSGHSGAQMCAKLRTNGFKGDITMFSGDDRIPYQRPPLSKAFLSGEMAFERLQLRTKDFYLEKNIMLHFNEAVLEIDRGNRKIHTAKQAYDYDIAIIATGGTPRSLPAPNQNNVFYLNNVSQSLALQKKLQQKIKIKIIGGGYIGLEVAATAYKMGASVQLFEAAPRILARVAASEISEFFTNYHQKHGVEFLLNAKTELVENGVKCKDEIFEANCVLVGIGMVPNLELAKSAGLKIDNGIITNDKQQSSDDSIYAIGDCAKSPHPLYDELVRLESVQNANYQAEIATTAICSMPPPKPEVPWFWSDQYDIKLQIAGLSQNYDRVIMRGNPGRASFALFYLAEKKLIAADCINRPQEFLMAKRALLEKVEIDEDKLCDESLKAKDIF